MGDTGTLLLVGALVIGGWCFLAGPCKGLISGTTGMQNLMNNPHFAKMVNEHKAGQITDAQLKDRAQMLGIQMRQTAQSNYTRLSII
jgi:hypothetical protein